MQTTDEMEIDLLQMLYRACAKWRVIVCFALVLMFLVGFGKGILNFYAINDPEVLEQMKSDYEAEMLSYKAEGEELQNAINTTSARLELQQKYNEESMLMKLDADKVWVGKSVLYVDTNYQIMPGSSVQNENPAYRIVSAYTDYASSGDFLTLVKEKLSFDVVDTNYLKEILSVSSDGFRYAVTVNVIADTEDHCKELLNVATEALKAYKVTVEKQIDKHTLVVSESQVYSQKDAERKEMQLNQETNSNELAVEKAKLALDYKEWREKEKEIEKPVIDEKDAVKNAVKWGILACIAGGLFLGAFYCLKYIISANVQDGYVEFLGLNLIGELPSQGQKPKKGIDLLLCRIFGIIMKESEYDARLDATAIYLGQLVKAAAKDSKVAVVSDIDEAALTKIVTDMSEKLQDTCTLVAAGNLQVSSEAVARVEEAGSVVLVVADNVSRKKNVQAMANKLNACGKQILGVVLTNVDAR